MTKGTLMAVDGGNSKTDLALFTTEGRVLALARGPMSSPQHLGTEGALDVLDHLLDEALRTAGIARNGGPVAEMAALLLAGADLPEEERELEQSVAKRRWARRVHVGNDTAAVLRAGTEHGWGIAVTCGAGINASGITADGREVRFPALGAITGDWGGGFDLGISALSVAARSEDGRGAKTALEQLVPAHFGLQTPRELSEAIHFRRISVDRLLELAPTVLEAGATDEVAGGIVLKLANEVVAMVRAVLVRLELTDEPVEVALGGGILRSRTPLLMDTIERDLLAINPKLNIHVTTSRPIVGAALMALDAVGGTPDAPKRLRSELDAASERVRTTDVPLGTVGITVNGGVHGRASSGRTVNG